MENKEENLTQHLAFVKPLSVDEISKLQQENEAYKQSEQEAQEIIAELQAYKDVNEDFKTAWEELKEENARLKENDCEQCKHLDLYIKYKQTLQEIKAIAEDAYENENEYQATGVYNEIIQKITKAEEE